MFCFASTSKLFFWRHQEAILHFHSSFPAEYPHYDPLTALDPSRSFDHFLLYAGTYENHKKYPPGFARSNSPLRSAPLGFLVHVELLTGQVTEGIWGTIFNAEILQNICNFYPDRQFIGIEVRDGIERVSQHIAMSFMDRWSERMWSGALYHCGALLR